MRQIWMSAIVALLVGGRGALALEAGGIVKKVDAANGRMVVFVNGQDRFLRIDDNIKVTGRDGQPLAGGIKSDACWRRVPR